MSATLSGAVFGLAAGLLPGPLLTDLPIVVVALFTVNRLAGADSALGVMSLVGAGFLAYLAYKSHATGPAVFALSGGPPRSLQKGAVFNLLNPHPHLFWFTVGAPIVRQAWATNPMHATGFLVAMYGCLVGSKMLLALLVGRGGAVLTSRFYVLVARALGFALLVFSLLLLRDGLRYLGMANGL